MFDLNLFFFLSLGSSRPIYPSLEEEEEHGENDVPQSQVKEEDSGQVIDAESGEETYADVEPLPAVVKVEESDEDQLVIDREIKEEEVEDGLGSQDSEESQDRDLLSSSPRYFLQIFVEVIFFIFLSFSIFLIFIAFIFLFFIESYFGILNNFFVQ